MTAIDTSTAAVTALMDGVTEGPWASEANGVYAFDGMRLVASLKEHIGGRDWPTTERDRNFIAAARQLVPALLAERDAALAGAVKVKPLVWEKLGERAWRAPSPFFGSFRVECYGGGQWQALWSVAGFCDTFVDGDFAGPDDAKQAIDARILAAIQPGPDARQADLAKAFCMGRDMAAETADDCRRSALAGMGMGPVLDAIRALTPPADLAAKIGGE